MMRDFSPSAEQATLGHLNQGIDGSIGSVNIGNLGPWVDKLGIGIYLDKVNQFKSAIIEMAAAAAYQLGLIFLGIRTDDAAYGQRLERVGLALQELLNYMQQLAGSTQSGANGGAWQWLTGGGNPAIELLSFVGSGNGESDLFAAALGVYAVAVTVDSNQFPDNRSVPANPSIMSFAESGMSAAAYYSYVIDMFKVEVNRRYLPQNGQNGEIITYCNIFVWDVTIALDCEIPRYYVQDGNNVTYIAAKDIETAREQYQEKLHEATVREMRMYLENEGKAHGWYPCTAKEAIQNANDGIPTVVVTNDQVPHEHEHIAMVTQQTTKSQQEEKDQVMVSQAGSNNFNYDSLENGFGVYANQVVFYSHTGTSSDGLLI